MIATVCELERKGLIESPIDTNGEVRWRITAKGIGVGDDESEKW